MPLGRPPQLVSTVRDRCPSHPIHTYPSISSVYGRGIWKPYMDFISTALYRTTNHRELAQVPQIHKENHPQRRRNLWLWRVHGGSRKMRRFVLPSWHSAYTCGLFLPRNFKQCLYVSRVHSTQSLKFVKTLIHHFSVSTLHDDITRYTRHWWPYHLTRSTPGDSRLICLLRRLPHEIDAEWFPNEILINGKPQRAQQKIHAWLKVCHHSSHFEPISSPFLLRQWKILQQTFCHNGIHRLFEIISKHQNHEHGSLLKGGERPAGITCHIKQLSFKR